MYVTDDVITVVIFRLRNDAFLGFLWLTCFFISWYDYLDVWCACWSSINLRYVFMLMSLCLRLFRSSTGCGLAVLIASTFWHVFIILNMCKMTKFLSFIILFLVIKDVILHLARNEPCPSELSAEIVDQLFRKFLYAGIILLIAWRILWVIHIILLSFPSFCCFIARFFEKI